MSVSNFYTKNTFLSYFMDNRTGCCLLEGCQEKSENEIKGGWYVDMTGAIFGYIRVSSIDQNEDRQLLAM